MLALYVLLIFLGLALVGFPVAIALGVSSLAFAMMLDIPYSVIVQTLFTSVDNFSYIAIPLFMLVGNLMETGGLSRRLVRFARSFFKKVPGSLGSISVASCAFFGAISGSASATTASIGGMMVPEMIDKDYPKGYAGALVAVAGTLGAIIPPSIVMIIYAVVAEVSVTDMFIAGFLPGLIMALTLIITNTVYCMVMKIDVTDKKARVSLKEIIESFWDAKWALLTPVIILGGIYSGIFTATECAVIATIYSLIVGVFIHKELTISSIVKIFARTIRTVGMVLIVVPMAITLGKLLTISRVTNEIGNWVLTIADTPNGILLIVMLFVFIAGMFMDSAPIILIMTPIFLPILMGMGVSPIHFGIIMTVGSMMAAVTPPVGVNLFIGQGIAGVDTLTIMKYATGFIAVFMMAFIFIVLNPWVSLTLVSFFK